MKKKCIIPGCPNDGAYLGACQKHKPAFKALADEAARKPLPLSTKTADVLATRISKKAREKLERVARATSFRSAYRVASETLERLAEEEIMRVLKNSR